MESYLIIPCSSIIYFTYILPFLYLYFIYYLAKLKEVLIKDNTIEVEMMYKRCYHHHCQWEEYCRMMVFTCYFARGEEHEDDDIDLIVRFDCENAKVGLFKYAAIVFWPRETAQPSGGFGSRRRTATFCRTHRQQRQETDIWEKPYTSFCTTVRVRFVVIHIFTEE